MKRIILNIAALVMMFSFSCCTRGFNRNKAEDILQSQEITEEQYDILLEQYEYGINDAIKFSQEKQDNLSENDREEIIAVFAIGKRLSIDEDKLTPAQLQKFTDINHLGTEQLSK